MFASEVEENGIPHGYVKIASRIEDLGDGITLEKTLAVESSRARVGFSGQRSTMVIHNYSQNGVEKLAINALAVFSSTPGVNICNLDAYRWNITNPGTFGIWNFYDVYEDIVVNKPAATNFSKYTVNYSVNRLPISYPRSGQMWIQCTANESLTTSGNDSWTRAIAQENVVIYDNVAYQFG